MSDSIQQAADKFLSLMMQLKRIGGDTPPPLAAKVSPSLMTVIEFVALSPNCGVSEISRGLQVSAPTVSVNVAQLVEAGLIERKPHPQDRRAVQVFLTPEGMELNEETKKYRRLMSERLLKGLESEERDVLLRLLEKALVHTETTENRIRE